MSTKTYTKTLLPPSMAFADVSAAKQRGRERGRGPQKCPAAPCSPGPFGLLLKVLPAVQMGLQTDRNYFRINYAAIHSRYTEILTRTILEVIFYIADIQTHLLFAVSRGGGVADQNCFGHNFDFIADADTEKWQRPRFLPTF